MPQSRDPGQVGVADLEQEFLSGTKDSAETEKSEQSVETAQSAASPSPTVPHGIVLPDRTEPSARELSAVPAAESDETVPSDSRDDLADQLILAKLAISDSELEIGRLQATVHQLEQITQQLRVQQHDVRQLHARLAATKREFALAWQLMHPGQRDRVQQALLSDEQRQARARAAIAGRPPGPLPQPTALA